ncbi:WcaF family extracellular polysaccharide biosynthesis acetyltransferase [Nocardioides sp.]|uniref:WcaF family extracellular polysaccharide biosynthesis acetyltransferase n=1 Tax=Nocardioides sp. TaxID=35761 RepID=UPI0035693B7E
MASTRDLRGFTGAGYEIGRNKVVQALWMLISGTVFVRWWCPAKLRVAILRAFGAKIGEGVLIRHRVRIHWPWKLTIGDGSWIGEGAWLLNLEPITIGANVCISQEAFLCTGSHDRHSPTFEFDNGPIVIEDGAWIAARAMILRGVTVGVAATVSAGESVATDVPPGEVRRSTARVVP